MPNVPWPRRMIGTNRLPPMSCVLPFSLLDQPDGKPSVVATPALPKPLRSSLVGRVGRLAAAACPYYPAGEHPAEARPARVSHVLDLVESPRPGGVVRRSLRPSQRESGWAVRPVLNP